MALDWINPEEYSFNCFLLMEPFQIRILLEAGGWRNDKARWRQNMGVALNANPAVAWYLKARCPECAALVDALTSGAPPCADPARLREAECYAMLSVEDFVLYTTPWEMAERCDFIRGWDKARLYALADFTGKTVLDVGAGSGRLSFAAAEKAAWVYASEPVGTLRAFLREKIAREGIPNVRVLDGFVTALPFPDDCFDIVLSGHVIGEDYDGETAELTRVCRPGGWLVDCPGDSTAPMRLDPERTARGWEPVHYVGSYGKDVYCYRKQVAK